MIKFVKMVPAKKETIKSNPSEEIKRFIKINSN